MGRWPAVAVAVATELSFASFTAGRASGDKLRRLAMCGGSSNQSPKGFTRPEPFDTLLRRKTWPNADFGQNTFVMPHFRVAQSATFWLYPRAFRSG